MVANMHHMGKSNVYSIQLCYNVTWLTVQNIWS